MIALTRSRQIILASAFLVPMMVAIGAVGNLVSLDASLPQPLRVPALEDGKTEPTPSIVPSLPESPEVIQAQTDRERQNAAQAQLQDGDWLMKRGEFKAARSVYQALIARSDLGLDSDLKNLAGQRLEKLEKTVIAANLREKQTKLKADAKKKSLLKPEVKSALKTIAPTAKPVALIAQPLSVSSPEELDLLPGELPPTGNKFQPAVAGDSNDLMGTTRVGESVRFERLSDRTTELGEPEFEPEAARVRPRLVPNSGNE